MSGFLEMIFKCHSSFNMLFSIVCILGPCTFYRAKGVRKVWRKNTKLQSFFFSPSFFCPFTSLSLFLLPVFMAFAGPVFTYNYNTLFIQLMSFNVR